MSERGLYSFVTVKSTEPSFNSTLLSSTSYALESTATNRVWSGPSGRAVRVSASAANDYYISFGTSDVVTSSTKGTLILGGTVETFKVRPSDTHIAIAQFTTTVTVNVTLGYGQ